ncbi:MAG: AraC family transcriptional regulator [Verrucomicrobiaceae bacterium]
MIEELTKRARKLSQPDDYFSGLDWAEELLPREILAFCRFSQDHRTSGWEGISAKAGRYDQHCRYVMIVALEGEGMMGAEAETWELRKGDVALLRPYTAHYYVDLPEEFCWLYVTFELDRQLGDGVRTLSTEAFKGIERVLELYEAEDALGCSRELGDFLKVIDSAKRKEVVQPVDEGNLIGRVKEYIMGHLDRDLGMAAISKEVGVSESYLRAQFREGAGVSLGNFVRSVRLVRATYLMQDDGLDLRKVALKSGFNSLTSFTRAFRRMYDITPSQFRQKINL